jgi:hypothetical protein
MNCNLCEKHIIATMQIAWNGGNFHPDCIGEAVARKRAADEKPLKINAAEIESLEDDEIFLKDDQIFSEDFTDDIADGETDEFADFDQIADRLDDIDDITDVDDEILKQIPVSVVSGATGGIYRPNLSESPPMPQVPEFSHPYTAATHNGTTHNGQVGTLISGMTTTIINREALKHLPLPEETETFKPISHFEMVEQILQSLSYRRLSVVREEYAVSHDGMKLFGLIELDVEYAGVRFAVGLRNANDKSMRVGLVAGYRVMVCENKMLTGDFNPLSAKHSKNFQLTDALSVAVDRIQRSIGEVSEQVGRKKVTTLSEDNARSLIYQGFLEQKFPISLLRAVHREYFIKPSFDEFRGNNLWSLENAFTTTFKKLKPVQQFEAAAKLGKFLSQHISPF